jgi:hypothetical protein
LTPEAELPVSRQPDEPPYRLSNSTDRCWCGRGSGGWRPDGIRRGIERVRCPFRRFRSAVPMDSGQESERSDAAVFSV